MADPNTFDFATLRAEYRQGYEKLASALASLRSEIDLRLAGMREFQEQLERNDVVFISLQDWQTDHESLKRQVIRNTGVINSNNRMLHIAGPFVAGALVMAGIALFAILLR